MSERARRPQHQLRVEEVKPALNDPFSITIPDPHRSTGEIRYSDIGCSAQGRMLVVLCAERTPNIRIISCGQATRRERRVYEEYDF